MYIDLGLAGLIFGGVVAALTLAFGYGALTRSVRGNRADIDENKKAVNDALAAFRIENAAAHKGLHDKLDTVIANGGGKH